MLQTLGVIGASVLAITCLGCAGINPTSNRQITILTYNIHHGEGTDGRLDLERIARIIKESGADLVALQEVDQKATRSGRVDQAEVLGRLTGMHHVFGKAMDFQGGGYGQAVLSKWPIRSHKVHQLPQRQGREPRIAMTVELDGKNGKLVFTTTHLDHEIESMRKEQVEALNRLFPVDGATVAILAGDFNAVPESAPMQFLWPDWRDAASARPEPTIPAEKPTRRIDYILLRPKDRWDVISSRVLNEPVASDHRPVLASLREQR